MIFERLVKCTVCGSEAWNGLYEHKECCSIEMEFNGRERYDIHGAMKIAAIRYPISRRKSA